MLPSDTFNFSIWSYEDNANVNLMSKTKDHGLDTKSLVKPHTPSKRPKSRQTHLRQNSLTTNHDWNSEPWAFVVLEGLHLQLSCVEYELVFFPVARL